MVSIEPLLNHPKHVAAVANLVYREFWIDVEGGFTEAQLAAAFGKQVEPELVIHSLVALQDDAVLGCVHLIHSDDSKLTHLHPWLAAMVVRADRRGEGIGTRLVQALARDAAALGFTQLWFGTDGPGFYERLGAERHFDRGRGFWTMRLALAPPP